MAGKKNYNKISTETNAVEEPIVDVVEDVEVAEEAPAEIPTPIGIVCNCKKLNVRKKADVESKSIAVLDIFDEVSIVDSSDKIFYEITTDKGVKGFCMKKYIKLK